MSPLLTYLLYIFEKDAFFCFRFFPYGEEAIWKPHLPGLFAPQYPAVQFSGWPLYFWVKVYGTTVWHSHFKSHLSDWCVNFCSLIFWHIDLETVGDFLRPCCCCGFLFWWQKFPFVEKLMQCHLRDSGGQCTVQMPETFLACPLCPLQEAFFLMLLPSYPFSIHTDWHTHTPGPTF